MFGHWNSMIASFLSAIRDPNVHYRPIGIIDCDPCNPPYIIGNIVLFICETVFGYTPL